MNNIFINTQVSLFTPTRIDGQFRPGTSPQTVTLSEALFRPLQLDLVETIRHETDEDKKKQLKNQLYAITPSAICKGGRRAECVLSHTGLMAFDIDNISGCIDRWKNIIRQNPHVLYLGESASGNGLWGLIPIAYPEKHAQHFDAMQGMFRNLGVEIDTAPRAVNSLRYLAYDPNAYVNPNAVRFECLVDNTVKPILTKSQCHQSPPRANHSRKDLSAWFNQNCTANDMYEILSNVGFTYHSCKRSHYYFTRPDKNVHAGLSVDYDEGRRTLFSFSSGVPMLNKWKQESNGWSCSPTTALMLYGCGGFERNHWKMAYDYIRSKLS